MSPARRASPSGSEDDTVEVPVVPQPKTGEVTPSRSKGKEQAVEASEQPPPRSLRSQQPILSGGTNGPFDAIFATVFNTLTSGLMGQVSLASIQDGSLDEQLRKMMGLEEMPPGRTMAEIMEQLVDDKSSGCCNLNAQAGRSREKMELEVAEKARGPVAVAGQDARAAAGLGPEAELEEARRRYPFLAQELREMAVGGGVAWLYDSALLQMGEWKAHALDCMLREAEMQRRNAKIQTAAAVLEAFCSMMTSSRQ